MNKYIVKTGALVLAAATSVSMVACKKKQSYDPETRAMTYAIAALDGNFNPFFATSAADTEVIGMTQVGMLSTDNDGNVDCGEDVPTVVLDYKITSYDAAGNVVTSDGVDHTTYEFVIKNGMKFSDGKSLTIDDVLFNLYVYLDPMYSGSTTIYSTDIQGLKAYRNNDPTLSDSDEVDSKQEAAYLAQQRIDNLASWSEDGEEADVDMDEIRADIAKVQAQFLKDLQSDWTSNSGSLKDYEDEYSFTADWQSYYLLEGLIGVQYEMNKEGNMVAKKDGNGKYVTDLTDSKKNLAEEMEAALSDSDKIAEAKKNYNCKTDEDAKSYVMRDTAISTVYNNYASEDAIQSGIVTILYYTTTGSNILDNWTDEELSKKYDSVQGQSVTKISGINQKKVTSFNGVNKVDLKGEEHDVLTITINGIDPKAIWNFAFNVSPMHYYSDAATLANKTDYPYGVRPRNKAFFDDVLNDPAKSALPVGAGAYRASNENGNASSDPSKVDSTAFWESKCVYFERNEYFETMGSGLSNAKIKKFTYVEVGDDNILNKLVAREIDFGAPSATPANQTTVTNSGLGSKLYKTNGYGYVGINPKFVPDLEVRQAIMMSFDTSQILGTYYGGTLAEEITRPMTRLSWAYPTNATRYYAYDNTGKEIEKKVESAGYKKNANGIYEKNGKTLEYKFTIAGATTDHPAYQMFEKASQLLNKHGFKITVGTDVSALKKLATGNLAVWAAAWTSTIDPDMYQIYHKDSQTTNRKNWNYDEILNTSKYPREKVIVNELSDLIEDAREIENQTERAKIYAKALNKVMELAVEFPSYQRNDLLVYDKDVIDDSTFCKVSGSNYKYLSPTSRIWEINYR